MASPILIIENDLDYRTLLTDIVRGLGYEVLAVNRVSDAIRLMKQEVVSLILLDIKMPQVWGHQFARYIRKRGNRIPIIVISGFLTPDVIEVLRDHRVRQIIAKPFKVKRIAEEIAKVLG